MSPAQKAIVEQESLSDLHHTFQKRRVRGKAKQDAGKIGSGKAFAVARTMPEPPHLLCIHPPETDCWKMAHSASFKSL